MKMFYKEKSPKSDRMA